jgi:hypothetical protein
MGLSDGQGQSSIDYYIIQGHNFKYYVQKQKDGNKFELPEGFVWPEKKRGGNTNGCGLLLYPSGKVTIFFTLNGKLMGEWEFIGLAEARL